MKIKFLFTVGLLAVALLFASCSKELEGDELDYVGTWQGDYTLLQIQTDGHGTYEYDDGIVTKSASGRVRVSDDKLKIGIKKFDLDAKPHDNSNGDRVMTLDGDEFYRW